MLLLLPKPPNVEVVVLPPLPNVAPVLLPNVLLLPKAVVVLGVFEDVPKRPPELFVVAPNPVAGFAAPNNEGVVLVLLVLPNPIKIYVSWLPKLYEAFVPDAVGAVRRRAPGDLSFLITRSDRKFIVQDVRPLLRR